MLKTSLFLLTISLSIPSLSQYTQSFEDMNRRELKTFLLENGNEGVQEPLNKYLNRQKAGKVLMISALSMVAIAVATTERRNDPYYNGFDFATLDNMFTAALGGVLFISGAAILAASESQFKKAQFAYLNPNPEMDQVLNLEKQFKENDFLNDESNTPEIKILGVKYHNTKKASKVMLFTSIGTLLAGYIASDQNASIGVTKTFLNASLISGSGWLTSEIIASRQLRKAKKLYKVENGITKNQNLINLDIRDDRTVYGSIFQ